MGDCICGGDGELCLKVTRTQDGGWASIRHRTKFCPMAKTGPPHRHNLVPCECQKEK